jgi:uncharacterized protein (TIGR03437 family)
VLTEAYPADLSVFSATIGAKTAVVLFAGLVGAGVFLINVQVPAGVAGGDQPVIITVNHVPTQANVMLTMAS